jgi:hypothetical protein
VSELLARARSWVAEAHPHARHLERTLDWLLVLDPEASEPLRIAAVTHDIERAFPPEEELFDSARDWASPDYNKWHQDRCADIDARWLREQGAPEGLVTEVDRLVRVHEWGGWAEADLLQAADSLSFLEVMADVVVGWARTGRTTRESAEGKLRAMYERMRPARALGLGAPLLDAALGRFDVEPVEGAAS